MPRRKAPPATEKKCTKCGEVKALDAFSVRPRGSQGRSSKCKESTAAYSRERYERRRETEIERTSKWLRENPDRMKEYRKKHAESTRQYMRMDYRRRPEVWSARKAVNYAVASGKLKRLPCELCGNPKSEGHHESYEQEQWLNVRWLCRKHHVEAHKIKGI
jgi:hypothetical protein